MRVGSRCWPGIGGTWLVAVPLGLLVIAALLPILENGFVDWDDDRNFLRNLNYRGLGARR